MMQKHSFGSQVECAVCHKLVGSVWASSWEDAAQGSGVCDPCSAGVPSVEPAGSTPADPLAPLSRRRAPKEQPSDG